LEPNSRTAVRDVTIQARDLYDRMLALYPNRINPESLWGAPLPQKAQLERSLTHRRVFANLVKPSPLSIVLANAAPFLKSNYGDELVRSPRMTGTIAEESMCQEK
jgi:hypothetical protein